MARSKQYNEQEVIEKRCLCSGAMGIKYLPRMLEKWASTNFLFMQVLEANMRFFRKFKCYKTKYILFSKNYKMEQME
jgi:hypothetical protein